jgi:hypothetical protein
LTAVSSSSGKSPARTRAISASSSSRFLRRSSARLAGSASVPALICSHSANSVSRRDSVPTNGRSVSDTTQAMAFSVAGVKSNCASSVPGL